MEMNNRKRKFSVRCIVRKWLEKVNERVDVIQLLIYTTKEKCRKVKKRKGFIIFVTCNVLVGCRCKWLIPA